MVFDYATVADVFGISFIVGFTRSFLGFGDSAIAVPLFTLLASLTSTNCIVSVYGVFMSAYMLRHDLHQVPKILKELFILFPFIFLGGILGLLILEDIAAIYLKLLLGVILFVFPFLPNLLYPLIKKTNCSFLVLITTGIFSTTLSINGPTMIIYSRLKEWSVEKRIVILQAIFFLCSTQKLIMFSLAGYMHKTELVCGFLCLPGIVLGVIIGVRARKKLSLYIYEKYVDVAFCILSISYITEVLWTSTR